MLVVPMQYIEPVFRPPSEARSLILQITNGCSWNRCTFCEMYTQPQKRFSLKPQDAIDKELAAVAASGAPVRRVFLADGDAMALSARRLRLVLEAIRRHLPEVQRVASYCLPRNLRRQLVVRQSVAGKDRQLLTSHKRVHQIDGGDAGLDEVARVLA